jgi:hypothetical protein
VVRQLSGVVRVVSIQWEGRTEQARRDSEGPVRIGLTDKRENIKGVPGRGSSTRKTGKWGKRD